MKNSYLAAPKISIARQIEHVHDQLRYSVAAYPKEDSLSILNQVQAMSLKALAC